MTKKQKITKPGRGRPPSPLAAVLPRCRCQPDELEAWQAAAAAEGRTFSSWVRYTLNRVRDV